MIGRSSLFAQVLNQIARRDFAHPAGAGPARGREAPRIYKDRWQPEMPLPLFANILDSIRGGHEIESGHSGV